MRRIRPLREVREGGAILRLIREQAGLEKEDLGDKRRMRDAESGRYFPRRAEILEIAGVLNGKSVLSLQELRENLLAGFGKFSGDELRKKAASFAREGRYGLLLRFLREQVDLVQADFPNKADISRIENERGIPASSVRAEIIGRLQREYGRWRLLDPEEVKGLMDAAFGGSLSGEAILSKLLELRDRGRGGEMLEFLCAQIGFPPNEIARDMEGIASGDVTPSRGRLRRILSRLEKKALLCGFRRLSMEEVRDAAWEAFYPSYVPAASKGVEEFNVLKYLGAALAPWVLVAVTAAFFDGAPMMGRALLAALWTASAAVSWRYGSIARRTNAALRAADGLPPLTAEDRAPVLGRAEELMRTAFRRLGASERALEIDISDHTGRWVPARRVVETNRLEVSTRLAKLIRDGAVEPGVLRLIFDQEARRFLGHSTLRIFLSRLQIRPNPDSSLSAPPDRMANVVYWGHLLFVLFATGTATFFLAAPLAEIMGRGAHPLTLMTILRLSYLGLLQAFMAREAGRWLGDGGRRRGGPGLPRRAEAYRPRGWAGMIASHAGLALSLFLAVHGRMDPAMAATFMAANLFFLFFPLDWRGAPTDTGPPLPYADIKERRPESEWIRTIPLPARSFRELLGRGVALALSPLVLAGILLLAVVVKLDSRGPVFFPQERLGAGGKSFMVWKLRSMKDGQVTRFGRIARVSRMDEIPQVLQNIAGLIRWVSSRPRAWKDVDASYLDWMRGTNVVPGMVDRRTLRNVTIRGGEPMMGEGVSERERALEREDVARSSLWYDGWIILSAPVAIIQAVSGKVVRKFLRKPGGESPAVGAGSARGGISTAYSFASGLLAWAFMSFTDRRVPGYLANWPDMEFNALWRKLMAADWGRRTKAMERGLEKTMERIVSKEVHGLTSPQDRVEFLRDTLHVISPTPVIMAAVKSLDEVVRDNPGVSTIGLPDILVEVGEYMGRMGFAAESTYASEVAGRLKAARTGRAARLFRSSGATWLWGMDFTRWIANFALRPFGKRIAADSRRFSLIHRLLIVLLLENGASRALWRGLASLLGLPFPAEGASWIIFFAFHLFDLISSKPLRQVLPNIAAAMLLSVLGVSMNLSTLDPLALVLHFGINLALVLLPILREGMSKAGLRIKERVRLKAWRAPRWKSERDQAVMALSRQLLDQARRGAAGEPGALIQAERLRFQLLSRAGVLPPPGEGDVVSLLNGMDPFVFEVSSGAGHDRRRDAGKVVSAAARFNEAFGLDMPIREISRNHKGNIVADFEDPVSISDQVRSLGLKPRVFLFKHSERWYRHYKSNARYFFHENDSAKPGGVSYDEWRERIWARARAEALDDYARALRGFIEKVLLGGDATVVIEQSPDFGERFVTQKILSSYGYRDVLPDLIPGAALENLKRAAPAEPPHKRVSEEVVVQFGGMLHVYAKAPASGSERGRSAAAAEEVAPAADLTEERERGFMAAKVMMAGERGSAEALQALFPLQEVLGVGSAFGERPLESRVRDFFARTDATGRRGGAFGRAFAEGFFEGLQGAGREEPAASVLLPAFISASDGGAMVPLEEGAPMTLTYIVGDQEEDLLRVERMAMFLGQVNGREDSEKRLTLILAAAKPGDGLRRRLKGLEGRDVRVVEGADPRKLDAVFLSALNADLDRTVMDKSRLIVIASPGLPWEVNPEAVKGLSILDVLKRAVVKMLEGDPLTPLDVECIRNTVAFLIAA